MLGPYLEDIELLLFESKHTSALPSRQVIAHLSSLANDFDLSYNVHLPTDISLSSRNPDEQAIAVDTILRVMELIETLAPSTLTLHVPYDEDSLKEAHVKNWQERVFKNLTKILAAGVKSQLISIENLDYPFEIVEKIICDLELSICLDLGHLIVHDDDIQTFFNRNRSKISIMHLYGVDQKHYHKSLNQLPERFIDPMLDILKKFKGSVSLEVFALNHLTDSLKFLEKHWLNSQSDD
jgi:sugar phosphate isomerase/epimerase